MTNTTFNLVMGKIVSCSSVEIGGLRTIRVKTLAAIMNRYNIVSYWDSVNLITAIAVNGIVVV